MIGMLFMDGENATSSRSARNVILEPKNLFNSGVGFRGWAKVIDLAVTIWWRSECLAMPKGSKMKAIRERSNLPYHFSFPNI